MSPHFFWNATHSLWHGLRTPWLNKYHLFLFSPELTGLFSIPRISHTLDCLITFTQITFLSQHLCLADIYLTSIFNLKIPFSKKILPGQHPPFSAQTNQASLLFLLFPLRFSILTLQVIYAVPTFPIVSCSRLHSWGGQGLSILCSAV